MSQARRVGNEAATQAQALERTDSGAEMWSHLRPQFSPRVQGIVDAAIANGGVTLDFIALLELAEHERLIGEIEKLRAKSEFGHKVSTALASFYSLRAQCRRHMRVLRIAMNPLQTPNEGKANVPARVASKYGARPAAAGGEAEREADGGDDLMSAPRLEA